MVVKVKGDFVWHTHTETDDFFLVLSGRLKIQLSDRDVMLEAGELFVVPRGVEHRPTSAEGAEVLLIEPQGTVSFEPSGSPNAPREPQPPPIRPRLRPGLAL